MGRWVTDLEEKGCQVLQKQTSSLEEVIDRDEIPSLDPGPVHEPGSLGGEQVKEQSYS